MSKDILLSGLRGLSIGGIYYDALLLRTRELVADDAEAVATLDEAVLVGLWSPEQDPPAVRSVIIPALQLATREKLLELDALDRWDERDVDGKWLPSSIRRYADFEDDLAAIYGLNPSLPPLLLRHDLALRELRRTQARWLGAPAGWDLDIVEVSSGHWRVIARDNAGHTVEREGGPALGRVLEDISRAATLINSERPDHVTFSDAD